MGGCICVPVKKIIPEEVQDYVVKSQKDLKTFISIDEEATEEWNTLLEILAVVCKKLHYYKPLPSSLVLLKRAQYWIHERENLDFDQAEVTEEKLNEWKRMVRAASQVYKASISQDPKQDMGIGEQDKILKMSDKEKNIICPKFILMTDHGSKSIVLAIRGTKILADVFIDALANEKKFLDGSGHRGIIKSAKRILKKIKKKLSKALTKYPGYKLDITGHSLGAGVAIIIAMKILAGKYDAVDPNVTPVKCVALAPPPVYM